MVELLRPVTILYGSETGNAQDYAEYLARRLKYFHVNPTIAALDDFPLKNLVTETRYLIIVCSTTGQGEVPRNGRDFMKFLLRKKLPSDLLSHIKLTSFGIGDSSYPKFNYAIKKMHMRLLQLGCQELCPRSEADELAPEGVDGYFVEWQSYVVRSLQDNISGVVELDDAIVLPCNTKVVISKESPDIMTEGRELSITRNLPGIKNATIELNKRLTADDHFQDVRLVRIKSEGLRYAPGDTVSLYPCNDDASVEILIQLQPHWIPYADKPLSFINLKQTLPGGWIDPLNLTLRSLFKYHLDIQCIPRRSFFQLLWHFCDNSTEDGIREQEKLKEFSNFDDPEGLYDYANRPRRLLLETLLEFQQNLVIPLEYVFDLFPKIKPRLFLIASRPSVDTVEIAVAIVEYKTIIRRIRKGLCTKWLKLLKPGDELIISLNESGLKFSLPDFQLPPIIMIAPGTGIAPMRSLIGNILQQRLGQPLYLFFGCRFKEKDFLFKDEWEEALHNQNFSIFPCFSRDDDSGPKYVQDGLFARSNLIGDLIVNQNAIVFVCGSSGKMPREVRITLEEILVKYKTIAIDEAAKFLITMENRGRYIQETW